MTDFRHTDGDLGDEVLSAYLAGELDEAEEAVVDERLTQDPELAARLDRLAETMGALRSIDAVEPPPGFRERLDRRLAAEQAPEVVSLDRARVRRPRWPVVGVATAALVVVAVGAAGLLQGLAGFSAEEAADAPLARTQGVPQAETFGDDAAPGDGAPGDEAPEMADEERDAAAPAPEAPAAGEPDAPVAGEPVPEQAVPERDTAGAAAVAVVVRDDAVELPDEVTIRRRYRGLPEAAAVLGASGAEAERLAAGALASLDDAGVSPGGVPATACVGAVETAVGSPSVVVLVESAVTPRGPALAHVVVSAAGARLDRVEALLLDPGGCTPLVRVAVGGGRE